MRGEGLGEKGTAKRQGENPSWRAKQKQTDRELAKNKPKYAQGELSQTLVEKGSAQKQMLPSLV